MLIHWIWFATRTGMGDKMKCTLLSHFEDPEEIYFAPELEFERFEELSPSGVESIMDKDLTACEEILESCQEKGIHILTYRDAAYPARLKNIPDPPMVLYYKGSLPAFDELPVIGVVGTRRASAYGLTAAKRLGYQIAACGGCVVSGMATGIDGTAMKGALTAGGTVVGILGCGADIVYPASNRWLYADTEKYGCILSEFPPGTPPVGRNFPRRNRIISGLSCGVLVVEAPEKSGALIIGPAFRGPGPGRLRGPGEYRCGVGDGQQCAHARRGHPRVLGLGYPLRIPLSIPLQGPPKPDPGAHDRQRRGAFRRARGTGKSGPGAEKIPGEEAEIEPPSKKRH